MAEMPSALVRAARLAQANAPRPRKLYACFLRKLYPVADLARNFGMGVGDIQRLNLFLGGYAAYPGGQVVILSLDPTNIGPREKYRTADFVLREVAAGEDQIKLNLSSLREKYREHEWTPPKPDFGQADREATFGRFEYVDDATNDPDGIRITDGWASTNVGKVMIPQLKGVQVGASTKVEDGNIQFYKRSHEQLRALFAAWENANLTRLIHSWDGSFNPRYMRNAAHIRSKLSNHAWGTAFDINARWNPLGSVPKKLGEHGCVREMAEIANLHGFYWGGHFGGTRPDGMHFEIAKIL